MAAGEFKITADERRLLSYLLDSSPSTLLSEYSFETVRRVAQSGWMKVDGDAYTLTDLGRTVARQLGIRSESAPS